MNDKGAYIGKTLEDLRSQLNAKLDEVREVLTAINALEKLLGVPRTELPDLGGGGPVRAQEALLKGGRGIVEPIRPDEFLGDPPLAAAKKYIKKVGRAIPFDEIAEAISKGGAAITGADWKDNLIRSLTRSTLDVVKLQGNTFGLTEFYTEEQLRGLRSTRRQRAEQPRQRRGRPRRRRRTVARGARDQGGSEPSETSGSSE